MRFVDKFCSAFYLFLFTFWGLSKVIFSASDVVFSDLYGVLRYNSADLVALSNSNFAYDDISGGAFVLNPSLFGERLGYKVYSISYSHLGNENIDDISLFLNGRFSFGGYGFFVDYRYIYDYEYNAGELVRTKKPYSVYSGFNIGRNIYRLFSFGVGLKGALRYDANEDKYYSGFFCDVALSKMINMDKVIFGFPKLYIAFISKNFHPRFSYNGEFGEYYPEYIFSISLVYEAWFALHLSSVFRQKEHWRIRGGIEFSPIYFLKLRGGLEKQFVDNSSSTTFSLGMGIGSNIGETKKSFSLEYGIAFRGIGYSSEEQEIFHSLSLRISFGGYSYHSRRREVFF